jgi:SAM-dependent methyltransferase
LLPLTLRNATLRLCGAKTMLADTQNDLYFERMAASLKDKVKILPFVSEGKVLDVGAGGGEFTLALMELGNEAYALDGSEEAVHHLEEKDVPSYQKFSHEIAETFDAETFDSIVCSSIIHEIFSYGDDNADSAYTLGSVENSLEQFHQVLKDGGRLIIRDGIAPANRNETVKVLFKDPEGVRMANKYLSMIPFKTDIFPAPRHKVGFIVDEVEQSLTGDAGSIMEFIYTYTWGEKSYPRETQELYGVFTLTEYVEFLEAHGFNVLHAEEYLQEGYPLHLKDKIALYREDGTETPFPMSNCLIVAEKK